jgi:hypothetical protein
MMWLNALVYYWVPRKFPGPRRCGSFPQGTPLGSVAPVFPGQEWWGRPWHWVPDYRRLAVGGVGHVRGVGPQPVARSTRGTRP